MKDRHFRVITDEVAFGALKPDWDALYGRSSESYYSQSFDWCWHGWAEVAKPRGGKLYCLVATEGDSVVLIWPFVRHRKQLWSIVRPLNSEATEYSHVLVEEDPEADFRMAAAWKVLRQTLRDDVLRLPFVRDGSGLHRLVATEQSFSFAEQFATSTVDWMASPSWETYYRRLDKRWRVETNRRRRRLAEVGKVTFIAVVDIDQQPAVIDWIIEQKRQWLVRRAGKSDWLGTEDYRRFLIAVAERVQGKGRVIASALKLNDAVIAASLRRVSGTRIEIFMTAYDPSYRRFSPSNILYEESLRWCFEQGLEVDLRIGNEPFKDHWHLRKSTATTYDIATSPWGAAFVLLKRARRRWRDLRKSLRRKSQRQRHAGEEEASVAAPLEVRIRKDRRRHAGGDAETPCGPSASHGSKPAG